MGSGSSRIGARSTRRPRSDPARPKLGLASFLCGGASSSSSPPPQMENTLSENLVMPFTYHDSTADNIQCPVKDSSLRFSLENSSSSSMNEHLKYNMSINNGLKGCSTLLQNAEASNSGKRLLGNKELVPCLENGCSGFDMSHSGRTCDLASTSESEHQEPLFTSTGTSLVSVPETDDSTDISVSQTSPLRFSSSMSQLELGDMPASVKATTDNSSNEMPGTQGCDSNPALVASTSSSSNLFGPSPLLEANSGANFVTLDDTRNGSLLHVDVVSISSDDLPSSMGGISNHEARRNSRRLFWDAFSRRSTRRNYDSPMVFSSTQNTDDLGSHDRWLDIGDDLFGSRFDHDSVYLRHRSYGVNGRRWHSRSEIRERQRGGFDNDSSHATFCPSGLHPDGTCSCDSLLMTEESSARSSISRIVMLAEALFEVLDEIHRQPLSLSLSVVSLPAPESIVNSLPVKSHIKHDTASADDVTQCYICLAEYEEGDKIRVLPCHHEYHMSCVDKWLKEIHGVCPLCRGDVCKGTAEGSA